VRRIALAALACLVVAPAAHADCGASASVASGAAPLRVVFTATCTSTAYHWDFGDGQAADGASVEHVYAAGRFAPALTTDAGAQALPQLTSISLRLLAPHRARYAGRVTLRAQVVPADVPVHLTSGRAFRKGKAAVVVTHPVWTAVAGGVVARVTLLVKPALEVRLTGAPTVGSPLHVIARLHPASAGTLRVRVDGRPTTRVDTSRTRTARIVVSTIPHRGWAGPGRVLSATIVDPSLGAGSRGASVRALELRLRELHYALRGLDGYFGDDDYAAVLAFQKVNGLARTGAVTPDLWRRLAAAHVPLARYPGTHVEVDKTRQVLFIVRDGKVTEVVHVSTGATGNTPVGLWHVYSKVPGWSWVLWYPNFFLRGFAIHGYPSVPAYPASHGCVRVPMWVAPSLYAQIPGGFPVYVYY
jgi:peptidoglycan hydrolase-like protein with peptidoglycan-binding domain